MTAAHHENEASAEVLLDGYQVLAGHLLEALADRCPAGDRVPEIATIFWENGVESDGGACLTPEMCSIAMRHVARRTDRAGRIMRLVLGHMAREEAKAPVDAGDDPR